MKKRPRGLSQLSPCAAFIPCERAIDDPMTTEFANAEQEALSGLEKIAVKGDEIKQALLQGGSPAMPDDLRKRFDTFLNERCKGKDSTKLRFVIE